MVLAMNLWKGYELEVGLVAVSEEDMDLRMVFG